MNLADMLSYADIHQLNRIADHYACDCNTNSKRELIQSILNTLNRKDVFERYVETLSVEDIRFLNSLVFDPRDAYSLEELLARAQISRYEAAKPAAIGTAPSEAGSEILSTITVDLRGREDAKPAKKESKKRESKKAKPPAEPEPPQWSPRQMIVKFAHQGWLFNGYSHHTKYLYQVPADLKRRFGDSLARAFQKQLRVIDEPSAYRDEQRMLVEDIGKLLSFADRYEVELNAEGTMYKRSQQMILETFNVKEELVGKGGWRFGYGRKIKDYPNRFSLIYDYCFYNNLIEEADGMLLLTEKGRAQLLEGRPADPGAVYQFWLKLYKNPIHNVQTLVHWIERLAGRWVTLETLSRVLTPLIKPYYYDSPESILTTRIVLMMMHQGLLRIGEHPEEGTVVEMTKLGSSIVRGVYVPDDEKIALPADAAPEAAP
ncbi:hypothetical protein [Paenibacillus sp.]|uniref:hypothetical protein n=1 Tax=Paenibacillus sp. TaxID=58172 RepID=UPI0028117716|nr:hypothetical protein [Paenibacillus sp.]